MTANTQNTLRLVAPYVPFKSFLTALDNLRHGPPTILDRTVWPTFSGGLAGQMLAAFRFLGFITEEYETTELLNRAIDSDRRKEALTEAMRHGYDRIFDVFDLARATPKQLADILSEEYNVAGSTHKKALTFFLHAAKFTDLALSPAISRKTRSTGPRKRRAPSNGVVADPATDTGMSPGQHVPQKSGGSSRTIKLKGGGTATLAFDVDVWSMTPDDQEFVFGMIKRMSEYETARSREGSAKAETPEATTSGAS
jgi:hypothetical protein